MQSENSTNIISEKEKTDLAFVVDSTGSMGSYLRSLISSLDQIVKIVSVTNVIDRIRIISYFDYCDNPVIKSSEWVDNLEDLSSFINSMEAEGGGDIPEAAKTAAHFLLESVTKRTIVYWYADAPPHHRTNCDNRNSNYLKEMNALSKANQSSDWFQICKLMTEKNIKVYPMINTNTFDCASFYLLMSTMTGGSTLYLKNTNSKFISKTTIQHFLSLLGCEYEFEQSLVEELSYHNYIPGIIVDENDNCGFLPGSYNSMRIVNSVLKSKINPWVETNLRELVNMFNSNETYKDKIFSLFQSLLRPESVLALTYNVIFATFWRLICRSFDDPRKDSLREQMSETLEKLKKQVDRTDHTILTEWISDSYNQTYEVNEIIRTKAPTKVPALVYDTSRFYLPQEILELNRTCNHTVLSRIVDFLSSMRVVKTEEELPKESEEEIDAKGRPMPLQYVPLSLPNRYLFAVLPHLTAPGTNFSRRPGMILAMIAYITNNAILKQRAKNHLHYSVGKWIDLNIPENYAGGFINLVLKAKEFLTPEEIGKFEFYQKVYGIMINGHTELEVKQPFTPEKYKTADYKHECNYCGQKRSFTLLTKDLDGKYKCGLCHYNKECTEPCDETHSIYLECKSCQSNYALVDLPSMNVTPKCHACREFQTVKKVSCTSCQNSYCDPAGFYGETFECARCKFEPNTSTMELNVKFSDLYHNNREKICKMIGFEMPTDINIFGGHSVFAIKDSVKITDIEEIQSVLFYKKKPVLNSEFVASEMKRWIASGMAQRDYCMICFNEYTKSNLHTVCGRKTCKSVACHDCLKSWYGENKVGCLIAVNSLSCPFCKQNPSYNVLSSYNRQACAMVRKADTKFDYNWWYGWCQACFQPKKVIEKECAVSAPVLEKFVCDDCQVVKPLDSKPCPNHSCGIAIIKDGGCNHMECTACHTHFCWICADNTFETAAQAYDHLYKKHGGAFHYDELDDDSGEEVY